MPATRRGCRAHTRGHGARHVSVALYLARLGRVSHAMHAACRHWPLSSGPGCRREQSDDRCTGDRRYRTRRSRPVSLLYPSLSFSSSRGFSPDTGECWEVCSWMWLAAAPSRGWRQVSHSHTINAADTRLRCGRGGFSAKTLFFTLIFHARLNNAETPIKLARPCAD